MRFLLYLITSLWVFVPVLSTADNRQDNLPNVWKMQGGGQACPISTTEALTAGHVAQDSPLVWSYPGSPEGGTVEREWWDTRMDVALLHVVDGDEFARFYPLADAYPAIGDTVWVQGYDMSKGYIPEWSKAKIIHMFAGQVVFDKTPGRGSSGSCVLNTAGEIVAINTSAFKRNTLSDGFDAGVGVLVVGQWTPADNRWRKK